MTFHWFFTRQAKFFGTQFVRHPWMWRFYREYQEEMREYYEKNKDKIPAWKQGWISLLMMPGIGQNILINPTTMWATYLIFRDVNSDFVIDKETMAGSIIRDLDDELFLHPIITIGANLFGYMGDDYAPDPLVLQREAEFITMLYNIGVHNGLIKSDNPRPAGNFIEDWGSELREDWSGILPGSEKIEATSSAAKADGEIQLIAADIFESRYPEVDLNADTPEAAELRTKFYNEMNDPDSELYREAKRKWLWGEAAQTAASWLLGPLRPSVREISETDVVQEGTDTEGDISVPVVGDVKFGEAAPDLGISVSSKRRGGGRGERTFAKRARYNVDPNMAALKVQQDQYYQIGDWETQAMTDIYNDIYSGTWDGPPLFLDGKWYQPDEINSMTEDQRKKFGKAYLVESGYWEKYQELKDERNAFLESDENAEFATFHNWRKNVYEEGVMDYWEKLIEDNPNAKRYYDDLAERYSGDDLESRLVTAEAYGAAKGWQTSPFDPVPDHVDKIADPLGILDQPAKPKEPDDYVNPYHQELREQLPKLAEKAQKGQNIEISGPVRDYLEWVWDQPEGADISVDAFIEWDTQDYDSKAVQHFYESLDPITDEEAAETLIALVQARGGRKTGWYKSRGRSGGGGGRSSGGSDGVVSENWEWLFPEIDPGDEEAAMPETDEDVEIEEETE
jgi:hypothetical protein